MAVNEVRKNYLSGFGSNPDLQVLDLGTQISKEAPKNLSKKAEIIISIFSGKHVGYKMELKNLLYKQWKKWVYENPSFKVSDVLSITEVKVAIKEFYRRVLVGEMSWQDQESKMLELVQHKDGLLELRVVAFAEGLFTVKEDKAEEETTETSGSEITEAEEISEVSETVKEPSMVERLKALMELAKTDTERMALERAISMLTVSVIKKAA